MSYKTQTILRREQGLEYNEKAFRSVPATARIHLVIKLDVQMFRCQRKALHEVIQYHTHVGKGVVDIELLEGIEALLDHIADVAHDVYGMDTLLCSEED